MDLLQVDVEPLLGERSYFVRCCLLAQFVQDTEGLSAQFSSPRFFLEGSVCVDLKQKC